MMVKHYIVSVQYTDGKLNIRNSIRYIHHANMQIALPIMISTNGYGSFIYKKAVATYATAYTFKQ